MEKMSKALLTSKTAWSSRLCALTWRERDTKSGRSIFQLQASAPLIEEKGCGLLPTPVSSDAGAGAIIGKDDKFRITKHGNLRKINRNNKDGSLGLGKRATLGVLQNPEIIKEMNLDGKTYQEVKMWRTPDAVSGGSNLPGIKKALDQGHLKRPSGQPIQVRLQDQVREKRLWPTPTADAATNRTTKYKQGGTSLSLAAKMWPTPRAALGMTFKLSQGMADLQHKKYLETEVAYVEKAPGGTLNPTWVEWLMGYPAGYTDLKDWEILSSRKSRKKSATPSLKQKEKNETTD